MQNLEAMQVALVNGLEFSKDHPMTCVLCSNGSKELAQIVPCGHYVCLNCYDRIAIDGGNADEDVICPVCNKASSICKEAYKRILYLRHCCRNPCDHNKQDFPQSCKHCNFEICPKFRNIHKNVICNDSEEKGDEFLGLFSQFRDSIDFRALEAKRDEVLTNVSAVLDAKIQHVLSLVLQKLTTTRNQVLNELSSNIDTVVAGTRDQFGNFEATEHFVEKIKSPTSRNAMTIEEIVTGHNALDQQLKAIRDFASDGTIVASSLIRLQELAKSDVYFENKLENIADPRAICSSSSSGNYSAPSRPASLPPSTSQPTESSPFSSLKVTKVERQFVDPPYSLRQPRGLKFFRELGDDRFVVVQNFCFINIVSLSSLQVLKCLRTYPAVDDGSVCLSGDIAFFNGIFYFTNSSRRKIMTAALSNYSVLLVDVPPQIFLSVGEQILGLQVSASTRELIFFTESKILAAPFHNPHWIRDITPPWRANYSTLYLKALLEDQSCVIFAHFNHVLRCKFVVSQAVEGILLDNTVECLAQSMYGGNVLSCSFDNDGNFVVAEENGSCLQFFSSNGSPFSCWIPEQSLVPNFDITEATLISNGSSRPVILACECKNDRFIAIGHDG